MFINHYQTIMNQLIERYSLEQMRALAPKILPVIHRVKLLTHGHRRYFRDGSVMPETYYSRTVGFGSWDYDTLNMTGVAVMELRQLKKELDALLPPDVHFRDTDSPHLLFHLFQTPAVI